MTILKIASWNINSIRIRVAHLTHFLKKHRPDILCLQETKVKDEAFPTKILETLGYQYIYYAGQPSYNGVCIASKIPMCDVKSLSLINGDKRHISAKFSLPAPDAINYTKSSDSARREGKCLSNACQQQITLHNFYIPAGGYEADLQQSKFQHKINYLQEVIAKLQILHNASDSIILTGDLNIAPYENDVWSHKQMLNTVSHTPIERNLLNELRQSLNFADIARIFTPEEEKLYSWWSYRAKDWEKSDRGRRLDHIWVTQNLLNKLHNFAILKEYRHKIAGNNPSDHVPIISELRI